MFFPFLCHVSAQLPVCKYRGSLFGGCRRVWEPSVAGQGISADGQQCAGEGGHAGESSTRCGLSPISRVGQSRQRLCCCQREGGKLWAGETG